MPDSWRLIPIYEGTGVEQMAIDNWLLNQHIKGLQPSCLRFYTWRSPTISLGYHQRQFPPHWKQLEYAKQKIEIVRRPTGGRAVLHQGDLTYALITSSRQGVSRKAAYQQLCQFLITGWAKLGVELSFGSAGRGYIKNPNCFGTATAADLVTHQGYKLIGSAQVYRDHCLLQHGSMRLNQDFELFSQVFGSETLKNKLSSVEIAQIRSDRIINALTEAAADCFNISLETQTLTPAEIKAAITSHQIKLDRHSD